MKYDFKSIEKKWQDKWEAEEAHRAPEQPGDKKFYALDMFPYPSSNGLHVGHPEGYTATDIIARKRMMEGWDVLRPMGWDAFGLPAENFAIKTGVHPRETTWKNVDNFRRQLKMLGFAFDWNREVNTADPAYYRWTQWLFLHLYKQGLAYKRQAPVNWCESCRTVLANEQAEGGRCERCKNQVIQKNLEQWFFKITEYAERLLDDLKKVDWPDRTKAMQRNWIGRSEGAEVVFDLADEDGTALGNSITVFTTRLDTLPSGTFVILAPGHELVGAITTDGQLQEVAAYQERTRRATEIERLSESREITGAFTGAFCLNPLNGERLPVWIADFVLEHYGTGAVFADAHDARDFELAKKRGIPLKTNIRPPDGRDDADIRALRVCYEDLGVLYDSGEFDGLTSEAARVKIAEKLAEQGKGRLVTKFRLRDWLVSRQRYWGAPIPIIYCDRCGTMPVPEEDLPVLLPDDVDFRPTGESPLAVSESFHGVRCPECGGAARRESDTMDTFVDSSWYFLRYCSPHEGAAPFNAEAVKAWAPVDLCVGGAEHSVLHLLYSRFFVKALADSGLIEFDEPFLKLRHQGMILGEDGEKMSKSRGNVINPDEVVAEFGADTLRLYLMFMGDFEQAKPWSTSSMAGVKRFLDRFDLEVHGVVHEGREETPAELLRALHKAVKKVGADIEAFKFNTAISAMMILINEWQRLGGGDKAFAGTFVRLMAPFAPHLSEELWELLGETESVFKAPWPTYDPALTIDDEVEVVVQVNGKVRDRLVVPAGLSQDELIERAKGLEKIQDELVGKELRKAIAVPDKLVSLVIG
jgi:leucyl-tRNA synthetase